MTYITLIYIETISAEENTQLTNYLLDAMASGTTDGISTKVTRVGVNSSTTGEPLNLVQRSWNTESNANAYLTVLNTFTPPPVYAQVLAPLVP